jgi:hypothetical protein
MVHRDNAIDQPRVERSLRSEHAPLAVVGAYRSGSAAAIRGELVDERGVVRVDVLLQVRFRFVRQREELRVFRFVDAGLDERALDASDRVGLRDIVVKRERADGADLATR